jgi:hypothetical protein
MIYRLGDNVPVAGTPEQAINKEKSQGEILGLGDKVPVNQFGSLVDPPAQRSTGQILALGDSAPVNWTPAKAFYKDKEVAVSVRSPLKRKG